VYLSLKEKAKMDRKLDKVKSSTSEMKARIKEFLQPRPKTKRNNRIENRQFRRKHPLHHIHSGQFSPMRPFTVRGRRAGGWS
jgi:hypothetical protein